MTEKEFAEQLKSIQAKGYLVGGAIRDLALARIKGIASSMPKDRDYVVTGVSQKDFEAHFADVKLVGKSFPVYLVKIDGEECEVALARTERKVGQGHKGFIVHTSPELTIGDDLARRDLTVNSMAIDILSGELIDPYNGEGDLEKGILRMTTTAFSEDPLRVYRTARFAAELGMKPDAQTIKSMHALREELIGLSIERVVTEMKKALRAHVPSLFIETLEQAGVLDVHFPFLERLRGLDQPIKHHPEGDVLKHTKQVMDAGRIIAERVSQKEGEDIAKIVFACMMHDVGKFLTKGLNERTNESSYHGHELAGVSIAESVCDEFGLVKWKPFVALTTRYHGLAHGDILKMKPKKFVDFIEGGMTKEKVNDRFVYQRKPGLRKSSTIEAFMAVCTADKAGRNVSHNELFDKAKTFEHPHAAFLKEYDDQVKDLQHDIDISQYDGGEIGYQIHMNLRAKRIEVRQKVKQKLLV